MSTEFHDFEIEYSGNPESLDKTLQALGKAVMLGAPDFVKINGHYVVRVFGNPDYMKFACENQGYCKFLTEVPR
jgi:hypothetical protein